MFLGKRWLRGGDVVTAMVNKAYSGVLRLLHEADEKEKGGDGQGSSLTAGATGTGVVRSG